MKRDWNSTIFTLFENWKLLSNGVDCDLGRTTHSRTVSCTAESGLNWAGSGCQVMFVTSDSLSLVARCVSVSLSKWIDLSLIQQDDTWEWTRRGDEFTINFVISLSSSTPSVRHREKLLRPETWHFFQKLSKRTNKRGEKSFFFAMKSDLSTLYNFWVWIENFSLFQLLSRSQYTIKCWLWL